MDEARACLLRLHDDISGTKCAEYVFHGTKESHLFNFHQGSPISCPNHFDTNRLPTIISLPDIRNPKVRVAWGFIIQFYVGEDSRFTEEGVGIESGP